MMPKILALDLGTKTGVAMNYGLLPGAQTLQLATAKEVAAWGKERLTRRCDPRISRLFNQLILVERPEIVVFEDVEFSTYTKQTQLWSAFRTAVWLAFAGDCIECVPVTTLKKFATGSGAADKEAMRRAMFTQFPQTRPDLDDNAIDALWVLKWAEHNLGRIHL
jgi:Holliday junction resolvasome RuvABC endonuclease subunit